MTPRGYRRLAEQNEALAVKLDEKARLLREQAKQLREMASRQESLPRMQEERSMLGSKMELQNARAGKRVKIAASMTEHETDARKAVLAAELTPQDIASELKVGRSTVNAWIAGSRSIPREYADRLREKHRIPARAWKKISG